jgi:hypothetical protein
MMYLEIALHDLDVLGHHVLENTKEIQCTSFLLWVSSCLRLLLYQLDQLSLVHTSRAINMHSTYDVRTMSRYRRVFQVITFSEMYKPLNMYEHDYIFQEMYIPCITSGTLRYMISYMISYNLDIIPDIIVF